MAVETMSVRRAVLPTAPRNQRTKKSAMTIVSESGGTALSIPYAPQNVDHSNLINEYVTVDRPGLVQNVFYSHPMRPRMTFDLEVHDKTVTTTSGGSTVAQRAIAVIQSLQNMAKKGRVRISYGKLESGLWWVIDMSVKSQRRDPITDEITGATVTMTLLLSSLASGSTNTGPTSGGSKPPNSGSTPIKKPTTPSTRTYTVKRGDTLWAISVKFYGVGTKWKTIATKNGIKDPKKLKVGQKLKIP